MSMTKLSGFWQATIATAVLATMFTGCSRDPNVVKHKYLKSGQDYYDQGKYREAAIQFQNAIQADSRFAEAHYKLAETREKLEQWPEAFEQFSRTVELQPENYAAHLEMVDLLVSVNPPQ